MRKILFGCIVLIFPGVNTISQNTINGIFPSLNNQLIKLTGFDGFGRYTIDSARADEKGSFILSFTKGDYGMGSLSAEDNKAFIVLLAPAENLVINGQTLASPETVKVISGRQNLLFQQYASEHPIREQVLSAWDYLEKIYSFDPLFASQAGTSNVIAKEKRRIREEDDAFLKDLGQDTYAAWYLPFRKMVSSAPAVAQYRTGEIPDLIAWFRNINYTDPRLYKSGILAETIDSHVWLIENSGKSLDSVFIEMNVSIDRMIENLVSDSEKFNEITGYLFKLLERRSLFGSSEYLALKVLNQVSCTIDSDLASQMESYRAMKKGNIASDIAFKGELLAPGYTQGQHPRKLSEVRSKYIMLIFGASWCPMCRDELSAISTLYEKWKMYGVEIVFVSLDDDQQSFRSFAGGFPFISMCDYQKWGSPVVKSYHVFATPTMFLLDNKREILLRPTSARQMDAWLDWNKQQ